ncbi:hypothetical protein LINPERPRIM_LOCUS5062 [Linum perenne]
MIPTQPTQDVASSSVRHTGDRDNWAELANTSSADLTHATCSDEGNC